MDATQMKNSRNPSPISGPPTPREFSGTATQPNRTKWGSAFSLRTRFRAGPGPAFERVPAGRKAGLLPRLAVLTGPELCCQFLPQGH